jgi:HAD superfamily hydrolase (TIGR01662 family)
VCLDVGETLVDETRVWTTWADVLGVTPFTFMAGLGAVIARGSDHRGVFELVGRPDWQDFRPAFAERYAGFQEDDLYPDAKPAIDSLRRSGYRVAIIANQPAERTAELRFLGVRADVMAMSEEIGVHKPAPEFFGRALELMGAPPSDVAYVGDRLDNDVGPAVAAGMRAVWVRRGPWAYLAGGSAPEGVLLVDSLTQFVERIDSWWPR